MIPYKVVVSSLFQYLKTNTAAQLDFGKPLDRDPEAEGLNSWLLIGFPTVDELASRDSHRRANLTLRIEACGRSQDDIGQAVSQSDAIKSLLDRQVVELFDYSQSEEPVVGYIRFREPQTVQANTGVWQRIVTTYPGEVVYY